MKAQLFVVMLFLILFFNLTLFSPSTAKTHIPVYTWGAIIFTNLYLLYLIRSLFQDLQRKKIKLKISPVIIPIFLYIAIRSFFLDAIPRWDGSQYFNALFRGISAFDLSFTSFLNNFNWFGHPTAGFAFITSIGQLINPANLFALNLTSLILGALAVYCFYKVCLYLFGEKKQTEITLLTTIFALHPAFVGISTTYGPDFGIVVFFLIVLAAFLYEKWTLTVFFATMLVFTKETGAYAYAIFTIAYLCLIELKNWLKSRQLHSTKIFTLLIPLVLLLLYFIYRSFTAEKVFWEPDGNSILIWGDDCRLCFGIKSFNILQNMSIIFILNFNWVLSLVILASLIKNEVFYPAKYAFIKSSYQIDILRVLKFVFIGFVILFLFFIVYIMPRYMLFSVPLLIMFFYLSLNSLIKISFTRKLILYSLIPLFLIQVFFTIDPVSKKIFGTYQFGRHQVLKIGTEYLADGLVYNTQYIYIQRLLDKFIQEFRISGQNHIFIDPYAWGTFQTGWGHFLEAQPKIYYSLKEPEKLPNQLYYLSFPLMRYGGQEKRKIQDAYISPLEEEVWVLDQLTKTHQIQYQKKYDLNGYSVNVYRLLKHENSK